MTVTMGNAKLLSAAEIAELVKTFETPAGIIY
jgi:hypothetical protein